MTYDVIVYHNKELIHAIYGDRRVHIPHNLDFDIWEWMQENIDQEKWKLWSDSLRGDNQNGFWSVINFEEETDAMAFKLRWV